MTLKRYSELESEYSTQNSIIFNRVQHGFVTCSLDIDIQSDSNFMLQKDDTKLEIFGFGDDESNEDTFYCLVNLTKSPDGIDLEKLSMADPRKFDEVLNEMGCILLLRGDEVEELINRGDISDSDLHSELYELSVEEGIIS